MLIGWLDTELKDDARWPAYQKFLTETFRGARTGTTSASFVSRPSNRADAHKNDLYFST
jgi:hypothetical protein